MDKPIVTKSVSLPTSTSAAQLRHGPIGAAATKSQYVKVPHAAATAPPKPTPHPSVNPIASHPLWGTGLTHGHTLHGAPDVQSPGHQNQNPQANSNYNKVLAQALAAKVNPLATGFGYQGPTGSAWYTGQGPNDGPVTPGSVLGNNGNSGTGGTQVGGPLGGLTNSEYVFFATLGEAAERYRNETNNQGADGRRAIDYATEIEFTAIGVQTAIDVLTAGGTQSSSAELTALTILYESLCAIFTVLTNWAASSQGNYEGPDFIPPPDGSDEAIHGQHHVRLNRQGSGLLQARFGRTGKYFNLGSSFGKYLNAFARMGLPFERGGLSFAQKMAGTPGSDPREGGDGSEHGDSLNIPATMFPGDPPDLFSRGLF